MIDYLVYLAVFLNLNKHLWVYIVTPRDAFDNFYESIKAFYGFLINFQTLI